MEIGRDNNKTSWGQQLHVHIYVFLLSHRCDVIAYRIWSKMNSNYYRSFRFSSTFRRIIITSIENRKHIKSSCTIAYMGNLYYSCNDYCVRVYYVHNLHAIFSWVVLFSGRKREMYLGTSSKFTIVKWKLQHQTCYYFVCLGFFFLASLRWREQWKQKIETNSKQ